MAAIRSLSAWVGLMVFACGAAWAQQYPSKPVRVVIVFPPGGATDVVGRIAFQKVGEQLNAELKKAVADPGVASNLSAQTLDPMYMTPDEFARQLRADYDKFGHVVKISGARLD